MSKSKSESKGTAVITTPKDAARVQSAIARSHGKVQAGSYVSRLQAAAAKHAGKTNAK